MGDRSFGTETLTMKTFDPKTSKNRTIKLTVQKEVTTLKGMNTSKVGLRPYSMYINNGSFTVFSEKEVTATVTLYSPTGKNIGLLLNNYALNHSTAYNGQLSMNTLAKGTYVLHCSMKGNGGVETFQQKIVIEN